MQYVVYLAANNSVLRIQVKSDVEPNQEGPDLKLGDSSFRAKQVLAVVPVESHQDDHFFRPAYSR